MDVKVVITHKAKNDLMEIGRYIYFKWMSDTELQITRILH